MLNLERNRSFESTFCISRDKPRLCYATALGPGSENVGFVRDIIGGADTENLTKKAREV